MTALENNKGSASFFILPVIFCVLALVGMLWQVAIIGSEAHRVHSAMQRVALSVMAENADNSYYTKREGYTGAFEKGTDWQDVSTTVDAGALLANQLGLVADGDGYCKQDANGEVIYRISDIVVRVNNTAPLNNSELFDTSIQLCLLFPIYTPIVDATDVEITIAATAANPSKF